MAKSKIWTKLAKGGEKKMCFKFFDEKIKKLNSWDIGFIKISVIFFTIVLIKGVKIIWDYDLTDLLSIWWWLVLAIIFTIKPIYKIFIPQTNPEI